MHHKNTTLQVLEDMDLRSLTPEDCLRLILQTVPKMACPGRGMLAVCPRCGVASSDFVRCKLCGHELPERVRVVADRKAAYLNGSSTSSGSTRTTSLSGPYTEGNISSGVEDDGESRPRGKIFRSHSRGSVSSASCTQSVSPEPTAFQMTIEHLPYDLLLRVFSFVEATLLLSSVRGVSRRWRALALHRDAWRQRRVFSSDVPREARLCAEVLRLVPGVRRLEINSLDVTAEDDRAGEPPLAKLATTTTCLASEVELVIAEPEHAAVMGEVVRNQAPWGRLRTVELILEEGIKPAFAVVILDAVKDLDLMELSVLAEGPRRVASGLAVVTVARGSACWGTGSVKRLRYSGCATDPALQFLLNARADSLQGVLIQVAPLSSRGGFAVPSCGALQLCVNLTEANVPLCWETLCLLEVCESLRRLALRIPIISAAAGGPTNKLEELTASWISALSGAKRLVHLGLRYADSPAGGLPRPCVVAMDLVSALASPPDVPYLESLHLRLPLHAPSASSELRRLRGALGGLPRLRSLCVDHVPVEDVLDHIVYCGTSGPALRMLSVTASPTSCPFAGPSSLRHGAVLSLLRSKPRLHVSLQCGKSQCSCRRPDGGAMAVGLFAHARGADCSLHSRGAIWHQVI